MRTVNGECRRSQRVSEAGPVTLTFDNPRPCSVEAELVDINVHGFRIHHDSKLVVPGLTVSFTRAGAAGRAKVVWTQLLAGQRTSGLVLIP